MQTSSYHVGVPEVFNRIEAAGIVAVIVLDELQHALPVVESLLKGGVNAIELTLRTPIAMEAAKLIKQEAPEVILGMGTVITADQVKAVQDIGVDFAVAPGCNPKIVELAQQEGLPFAPGIMTPSEIEVALELGCRVLKFFPAETSGGLNHLNSMVNPYQYLEPKFIPLGGVNMNNAQGYLQSPLISAIGGSWVAKRHLIQSEDWETITQNARDIRTLISETRANEDHLNIR
ncbi:bifunctional 4-hydroxy-2-oxoglutarate aldolase/2-dehydro-3-deoxy-phosphogluconate aldolase [Pontibacter sp. G13]|uniref:bifunctional 4-hydroxy-2-oxoglutarate aldolase/2-dehydro-3-deoxy-phosphogluconate aldolase n=1 Tax=Pontibacter sp. G13 TaxID=3074898 RepID=UPI00288C39F3|nr:bifunctional 4-hydroxy-2-oxoglutarate aldolase/2-dehydro-3-deoxy-phosphogluconate aldolase [Pontibacter sp. G13]WNJ20580.1 bifunctional 4-hydroxy-2-oxoglutarate aldolase/2-dehydro-3-deoxy-phosphogluconate aldolase [Pontibacter sp. G13]